MDLDQVLGIESDKIVGISERLGFSTPKGGLASQTRLPFYCILANKPTPKLTITVASNIPAGAWPPPPLASVFFPFSCRLYPFFFKNKGCYEEAINLKRCCHVNILRYKESFLISSNGSQAPPSQCLNILMEFADDGNLHQHIIRQRDVYKTLFHESQVLNWFVQLNFALQHLHKNRILHRDVKSSSVFLTSSKLLKLGNFGNSTYLK